MQISVIGLIDLTGKKQICPTTCIALRRDERLGPPSFEEFLNFIYPEDRPLLENFIKIFLHQAEINRLSFEFLSKNGSIKYIVGFAQLLKAVLQVD